MHRQFNYDSVAERRARYIPYDSVEKFVSPSGNDVLVDIGAGDGFYSCSFAGRLPGGRVIAVEVDERGVSLINDRIRKEGTTNVEVIKADVCNGFSAHGYNKAFFSTTFHDIPCRSELVDRLVKGSSGTLDIYLIEFRKDILDFGPPADVRFSREELRDFFEKKGFRLIKEELLSHHYLHHYRSGST